MPKDTKKQHFVPQTYLENWAIPNTESVFVYDKHEKKSYQSSIKDIAQERYFSDIDFTDYISEEKLKELGFKNSDPKHLDDGQYLENLFSEIEGDLSKSLREIISRVNSMSTQDRKCGLFVSEEQKFNLSHHLALQYIRVKAYRNMMTDSADCLSQVMQDMGIPQEVIDRHKLNKSHLPFIHAKTILNQDYLEEMAKCFYTLSWLLRVNLTDKPFFTSDNPVGTFPYVHHPFLSTAGLTSKGVEAYYPLSPYMMLQLYDSDFHTFMNYNDGKIIETNNTEYVDFLNRRTVFNSDRFVYSQTDDFSIIDELLKVHPDALDQPKSVMNWGGKTYKPSRYQSN